MINSEDDILQEELNNLTRILLAHTYPLHLTIKKIKKSLDSQPQSLVIPRNTADRNQHSAIITPSSDMGKLLTATIHRNCHHITNDTTFGPLAI